MAINKNTVFDVECDECGKHLEVDCIIIVHNSQQEAIQEAMQVGWHIKNTISGHLGCLCPECAELFQIKTPKTNE